jgi:hypothetical protein
MVRKHPMKRLVLLIILYLAVAALAAEQAGGFTISYWCGPPASFLSQDRFDEIKAANFTLAFPPCGAMTVEQNRKMLDYCQKAGLRAVIQDRRMVRKISGNATAKEQLDAIIKDYSDHPALFGYFIADEPNAAMLPGLGEVNAYLKEKDPKHPGYINLLPTYARDFKAPGSYEKYLRAYVQIVKPFALSYDHYNFKTNGDRADFFENLETVRKVALDSKIPFWNIVLCVQTSGYRHLDENELRYEAMQTLAYGADGLLWFTYWSPQGAANPGDWHHAMINPDGSHDPHYDMVQKINADVLAFASALAGAQSTEVARNDKAGPKFTVGRFKSPEGKQLRFIANGDYKNRLSLPLAIPAQNPERFNTQGKQWEAFGRTNGKYIIELPPSGAALLRW